MDTEPAESHIKMHLQRRGKWCLLEFTAVPPWKTPRPTSGFKTWFMSENPSFVQIFKCSFLKVGM